MLLASLFIEGSYILSLELYCIEVLAAVLFFYIFVLYILVLSCLVFIFIALDSVKIIKRSKIYGIDT